MLEKPSDTAGNSLKSALAISPGRQVATGEEGEGRDTGRKIRRGRRGRTSYRSEMRHGAGRGANDPTWVLGLQSILKQNTRAKP